MPVACNQKAHVLLQQLQILEHEQTPKVESLLFQYIPDFSFDYLRFYLL